MMRPTTSLPAFRSAAHFSILMLAVFFLGTKRIRSVDGNNRAALIESVGVMVVQVTPLLEDCHVPAPVKPTIAMATVG